MNSVEFPIEIDAAVVPMVQRLIERSGEQGGFLRIGVKGGGCSGFEYVLKIDTKTLASDAVATIAGVEFRCDSKSAVFLAGAKLVHTGNLIGGGFKIVNPNAERECGCGMSFTPRSRN